MRGCEYCTDCTLTRRYAPKTAESGQRCPLSIVTTLSRMSPVLVLLRGRVRLCTEFTAYPWLQKAHEILLLYGISSFCSCDLECAAL